MIVASRKISINQSILRMEEKNSSCNFEFGSTLMAYETHSVGRQCSKSLKTNARARQEAAVDIRSKERRSSVNSHFGMCASCEQPSIYGSQRRSHSFRWLKNLVRIGLSRPIRNSDVYQTLDSHESKRKTDTFLHHWNIHTSKTKHPKLITVFAHVYAAKVLSISLLYTFFSVSIR